MVGGLGILASSGGLEEVAGGAEDCAFGPDLGEAAQAELSKARQRASLPQWAKLRWARIISGRQRTTSVSLTQTTSEAQQDEIVRSVLHTKR
jgi:hypothetical protein